MRKEASKEEWKKLYDVATRIKEIKPWEDFWGSGSDLFTRKASGKMQPLSVSLEEAASVMGLLCMKDTRNSTPL